MEHELVIFPYSLAKYPDLIEILNTPFSLLLASGVKEKLNKKYSVDYYNGQERSAADLCLFDILCLSGQLDLKNLDLTQEEERSAVKSGAYQAIRFAAGNGHDSLLVALMGVLSPEEQCAAVRALGYYAFRRAILNGHVDTVKTLMSFLDSAEQEAFVLHREDQRAFYLNSSYSPLDDASCHGDLPMLTFLMGILPNLAVKKEAVKLRNYHVILRAAQSGELSVLSFLMDFLTSEEKKEAVQADLSIAPASAALYGHLCTLKALMSYLIPTEQKAVVQDAWHRSISWAIDSKSLLVVRELLSNLTLDEQVQALRESEYSLIRTAAEKGDSAILVLLLDLLKPEEQRAAFEAKEREGYRKAIKQANPSAVTTLIGVLTIEEQRETIKRNNYEVLDWAIREFKYTEPESKHLLIVQALFSILTKEEQYAVLRADDFKILKWVNERSLMSIFHYFMMSVPSFFDYIEMHEWEYSYRYTHPLVEHILLRLSEREEAFELEFPNGVFDVSDTSEAEVLLYVVRNLIRRGMERGEAAEDQSLLLGRARYLCHLPSVRLRLHRPLGDNGQENDLLRFALQIGHQEAVALLMRAPHVRRLVVQNKFYQNADDQVSLDLRRLAQDDQSSMTALSQSEERQLKKVQAAYQSTMDEMGGQAGVMRALRADLEKRFNDNPAVIEVVDAHGISRSHVLPFEWDRFEKLNLSKKNKKLALEAYHSNMAHSAYRYLLKPNPWMDETALYVCSLYSDKPGEEKVVVGRYSTFEEYIPMMAAFYLASIDRSVADIDGYTTTSRADFFIRQLALIARAHNWDGNRVVKNRFDKHGQPVTEEFDNLEQGDRPTCYSGVKRRLFQSVLGHPLLMALTASIIKQTIKEHVRSSYRLQIEALDGGTAIAIQAAMDALCLGDDYDKEVILMLNLSDEAKIDIQSGVLAQLSNAYKAWCPSDEWHSFKDIIVSAVNRRLSVLDFASFYCDVDDLLEDKVLGIVPEKPPLVSDQGSGSESAVSTSFAPDKSFNRVRL